MLVRIQHGILFLFTMRYHYKKPDIYLSMYGKRHICNHPLYNSCTLFQINDVGIAVIQQRYDKIEKVSWWDEIDPWLIDAIYLNENFLEYFDSVAKPPKNDIYPTVTVRSIMWSLKMKPIPKQSWETYFDKRVL